jgi:hypothetical protein
MKRFLVFILFLVIMSSCDEENLSLPTPIELTFITEPLEALKDNLIVDRVEINLSRLEIEGLRDAGGNVFLERQLTQEDGYINLRSQINHKISIDIPQGFYNSLNFRLNFQRDEEEREEITEELTEWLEEEDDQDEDDEDDKEEREEDLGDIIEEYLEDINPAFLFTATASRNGTTFNIIMPLNDPIIFDVPFINNNGERNISLIKGQRQEFELVFNPDYWFSITSFDALNNAQKGIIEDKEYVFLHKQVNSALYSLVIGRIEESTVVRNK